MRWFGLLALLLCFGAQEIDSETVNSGIIKSLVRITITAVRPDYRAPWNSGVIQRAVGTGFTIDSNPIMTNAHVVANSRSLVVERDGDPNKYAAKILFLSDDCDLALITVANPIFFKGSKPLTFGELPKPESAVFDYGYPIGGESVSVTAGVISRIDYQLYTHSLLDWHLAIQNSAQINPGNSGGPLMQQEKVMGVAFQGYGGEMAQSVAYMVPTSVINRFLKDVSDGHYDGYMDLGISYSKLQNSAPTTISGTKR